MSENNGQHTESINQIIRNIDKEELTLPDFQRDFVWDESKTYDLFDSLVRDIFIGSIIYGIPSFEITVREIDKRVRKIKNKKRPSLKVQTFTKEEINEKVKTGTFKIVLDGQQRLTSIYRALRKIDEVWYVVKDEEELSVEEDIDFKTATLEQLLYGFSGYQDKYRLSINLSDIFEMMEEGLFESDIRNNYYNKLEFVQSLNDEECEIYFKNYLLIKRKIEDLFKAEKLVSYFLLDMSSDKFALFFERSNSLGISLNFIDILVAKLSNGFRLRSEVEKLQDTTDYIIDREVIVRTIAYFVSEGKNIDKGYILSNLNYEHFNLYWNSVSKMYIEVHDFLFRNNFVMTQDWIPHNNMVIPLIIFLSNLPQKSFSQMNQQQLEFIKYWYWSSIFAQRYAGGATNEVIIKDCAMLTLIAKNNKIEDIRYFNMFKVIIEKPEDLYSYDKKGSAIYKGILTFINYTSGGLADWKNNSKILFTQKVDDHHIFPKSYLRRIELDNESLEFADCVINRTLIPKITNIKISDNAPSTYMKEILIDNPNFLDCMKKHVIPEYTVDGLYDEFFTDFLEERSKIIFNRLKSEILDKKNYIKNNFYIQPKKSVGKVVPIFARYRQKEITATFNRETQEIFLDGEKFSSVSQAADIAKKKLSGKDNTSTNGWKFWKYKDGADEKYLSDIRY